MRERVSVAAAIRWIAEADRAKKTTASRESVLMLAAISEMTPEEIAAKVDRVRKRDLATGAFNQKAALRFIERYVSRKGEPPTYQEIADALSLSTASTAWTIVGKLAERGRVKLPSKQCRRGMTLVRDKNELRQDSKLFSPMFLDEDHL